MSLYIRLSQWDERQPWLWPRSFQRVSFFCAAVVGVCLMAPGWLHSWQAWDEANAAQTNLRTQQAATQTLRKQIEQWQQTPNRQATLFADEAVLTQLAQAHGLQWSHLGVDKPQHSPALNALHIQTLPVHLKVQGAWGSWRDWLMQWSHSAQGVTVSSLELQAQPHGGISARMVAVLAQSIVVQPEQGVAHVNSQEAQPADPFSAARWAHEQRAYAERHPSYARWVAPELQRPKDVLEAFPRERLQYVGQIESLGHVEALVNVLPPVGAKKESQMMRVHRVRVGRHLGQDFGKVLAIESDHMALQELVWTPTGEWQTRMGHLPLQEAAP